MEKIPTPELKSRAIQLFSLSWCLAISPCLDPVFARGVFFYIRLKRRGGIERHCGIVWVWLLP
jgi:hypothetical protein